MKFDITHDKERGRVYRLLEDTDYMFHGMSITVPEGFECDGASVPRFFWRLIFPPGDECVLYGAVLHDWLYRNKQSLATRSQADFEFYLLTVRGGVEKWRAILAWIAVRIFGGRNWKGNQS